MFIATTIFLLVFVIDCMVAGDVGGWFAVLLRVLLFVWYYGFDLSILLVNSVG